MNESDIVRKIEIKMDKEGLNLTEAAKEIGVTKQYLSFAMNKKEKLMTPKILNWLGLEKRILIVRKED